MSRPFEYVFPAIRGIQAGREYYVSMCPLRQVAQLFEFDRTDLTPELRAQRHLNRGRLPELTRYVVENPESYVFSAITASIDADIEFEPSEAFGDGLMGLLRIPMKARFVINDGQHRRAAIEAALERQPSLADESIAVVLFHDRGLERCQQMFADLNRYSVRPARSLNVLYDHRDELAAAAKRVALQSTVFGDLVEMERSALSARSRKLFTLSAIHTATGALFQHRLSGALLDDDEASEPFDLVGTACSYWETVGAHIPHWQAVRSGKMAAGDLREQYIHSHGVVLHALGRVGNSLLHRRAPEDWKSTLAGLSKIDWRRTNGFWEGRAMIGGRVSKSGQNVLLTSAGIKAQLGMPLSPEEQLLETSYGRRADAAE